MTTFKISASEVTKEMTGIINQLTTQLQSLDKPEQNRHYVLQILAVGVLLEKMLENSGQGKEKITEIRKNILFLTKHIQTVIEEDLKILMGLLN